MKFYKNYDSYIINEYLNQEEIWLKKYLNSDDKNKYINLTYKFDYLLEDFLNTIELSSYFNKEDKDKITRMIDDGYESYEILDKRFMTDDFKYDFGKFIYNEVDSASLPTNFYFDDGEIIKNQWLIHLTSYALDIWKDGFLYGTDDIEDLALTTYNTHDSKKHGGYNFAYTINDFIKYGNNGDHDHKFKYGDNAILFKCSGVRAWHTGDEEYQTIFYGKYATTIIWLEYGEIEHGDREGEDCWFIESRKNKVRLVEKENIRDLINWVETHYDQYRKHLTNS